LLVALSLGLLLLFGLGCVALQLQPAQRPAAVATRAETAALLALTLVLGVLLDYALVLIVGRLSTSLVIATVLSAGGLILLARNGSAYVRSVGRLGWRRWLSIVYLVVPYGVLILGTPLSDWDARSIWFLHGKMIFYNHRTFDLAAGWDQPFASFSHVGYPKLVPVLAAQFALLSGYWNEYLPKAALVVLLVPAMIALTSFVQRATVSALYLFVMMIFGLSSWLWNGYMDGYLALYVALSCLFFGRWLVSASTPDALCGIAFLAFTVSLKNEGYLAVICTLCALLPFSTLVPSGTPPRVRLHALPTVWAVTISSFLGPMAWHVLKLRWGLPAELPSSPMNVGLISERIQHGAAATITHALLLTAGVARGLLLVAVAVVASLAIRRRVPVPAVFACLTAGLYGAGMFLVYLTTDAELSWHLGASAERTMLPVLLLLFSAVFFIVADLEGKTADRAR
jgi:hypothetical protein